MNCFVEPLELSSKEVILLAVNNAVDPDRPGGSHWSLLAYTSQVTQFNQARGFEREILTTYQSYKNNLNYNYLCDFRPTISIILTHHQA